MFEFLKKSKKSVDFLDAENARAFSSKQKPAELTTEKGPDRKYTPFNNEPKPVDNVASFEIPDFTEDDLNFDLGLGEFMPGKDQPVISGQGLTEAQRKVPVNVSEPQLQPAAAPVPMQAGQPLAVPQPPLPSPPPAPLQDMQQSSRQEQPSPTTEENSSNEDLPSFQVYPSYDLGTESKDVQAVQSMSQRKPTAGAAPSRQNAPRNENKPVQTGDEGQFITKEEYVKTILLSDEAAAKSANALSQMMDIISSSESQTASVDDLRITTKSTGDSLMIADSKLFGKVMGNE